MAQKNLRTVRFTSQTQPWASPGASKFEFKGWIPSTNSKGQRYIIDGFWVHVQLTTGVTVATFSAADVWRAIASLSVQQTDGVMRYNEIPGDALRVYSYGMMGSAKTRTQYAVPTGAAQALTFSFYVPLAQPSALDPYATSLPVELFQLIRIGMIPSSITLGTSVFATTAGNYYVEAVCHAEPEGMLRSYQADVVTVNDAPAPSSTQMQIAVSGRPADMFMYLPGPGGGSAVTTGAAGNFEMAQVVGLYQQSVNVYPDLVARYADDKDEQPGLFGDTTQKPSRINPFLPDPADGTGSNAATNPRAVALLMSTGDRANEAPIVNQLTINFIEPSAPSVAPRLITRCFQPQNSNTVAAQAATAQARHGKKVVAIQPVAANPSTVSKQDAAYFPQAITLAK